MDFLSVAKTITELSSTAVILGAVIYLLVKYFSMMIEQKNKEIKVDNVDYGSISQLKQLHPCFNKINSIIEIKLPMIKVGGKVRTIIFQDVLKIFYKSGEEIFLKLLDKNITKENFLNENLKAINDIVTLSNKKMKEEGIPEVVIHKFWEWNAKRHEYMISTLSDINSSSVFDSIVEKEYAVLNLYQNNCYFVLMDAENTLKNLNGDLTGTKYKGNIIESLH